MSFKAAAREGGISGMGMVWGPACDMGGGKASLRFGSLGTGREREREREHPKPLPWPKA